MLNFKNKIKDKKGQALLLIIIVGMVSLAVVMGIVDRTYKQLTIQRQNAEYQRAFNDAESSVNGLMALISSGTLDISSSTDPNSLVNSVFEKSLQAPITLNLNKFDPLKDEKPRYLSSDSTLTVEPLVKTQTTSFTVWCDMGFTSKGVTDVKNSAVLIENTYRTSVDSSGNQFYNHDVITTICKENGTDINGGSDFNLTQPADSPIAGYTISDAGNGTAIGIPDVDSRCTNKTYKKIKYTITKALQKEVAFLRVTPKIGFANSATVDTCTFVKLQNGTSTIGSSTPVTGTAIGYGSSGRTATIRFSIPNTSELPAFFNYVAFEGQ
jgi:hypothetical protein